MKRNESSPESRVIGPHGPLTIADLPAPKTVRWVARRKAEIVAAVRGGLLSINDVRTRYGISRDEFLAWDQGYDRFGLSGLKATRLVRMNDRRAPEARHSPSPL